jgi:hypothetical protein
LHEAVEHTLDFGGLSPADMAFVRSGLGVVWPRVLFCRDLQKLEAEFPPTGSSQTESVRSKVSMSNKRNLVTIALVSAISLSAVENAHAQSIIKRPGAHPKYLFEAEPHLVLRDRHQHAGTGVGPGFRGTFVIVDDGFIPKLNDSVGIGFGLDWLALGDDHCHGNRNRDGYCHDPNAVVLPLVLQWNFWLHRKWSVFGEPGFAMVFSDHEHNGDDDDLDFDPFVFYAGGRFHFTDNVALTMRFGFPLTASVGVSFLL